MRKYGYWNKREEDITRCVVEIFDKFATYQCQRKRGYGPDGLYCKQHSKMLEKGQLLYVPKGEK